MRVLRLVAPDDFSLEFHPYVTVVTGLDEERRERVLAAFRAAVAGRSAAMSGLLEVHGVVLDLDDRSLGLLDLADVNVDVVVDAGDLPGAAGSGLGRQLRAAERRLESLGEPHRRHARALEEARAAAASAHETLERCRAELEPRGPVDSEVQPLEAQVAAAEEELQALAAPASRAAGDVEEAERALAAARADDPAGRIEDLRSQRAALESRRTRLLADLDPDAADAFEQALVRLRQIEADAPDPEAAAARAEEIRGALALHHSFDASVVRSALDAIRLSPARGELVPSPEAVSLADHLAALERDLAELDSRGEETTVPDDIEAVASRLDHIRGELVELELTSVPASLEDDIAELERAHAEVTEARERLDGRFGRARAEERLEQAVAAEEAALERLGIPSYTDFMTGGRTVLFQRAESDELRELRAREHETEAELRRLRGQAGEAKGLIAAEREHRDLCDRARELLGDDSIGDHELVRALRDLRVPAERSSPLDDLLSALESVGLRIRGLDLSAEDVEAMAVDWLDGYQRAEERRPALEAELAGLEAELAPPSVGEAPAGDAAPEREELVHAARDEVRSAKERMVAHETAVRELGSVDDELDALEGEQYEVDELARRIDAAAVVVEEARARLGALARDRAAAEARVLEGRAALEQRRTTPIEAHEAEAELEDAERRVAEADAAVRRATDAAATAASAYEAALEEVDSLRRAVEEQSDEAAPVEEIEWYLLARLAAQRQVSFAGSVPLVVDRALDGVGADGMIHLLERLERMAGAVQVVHLTDDEDVVRWAEAAGDDRVAIVAPRPAVTTG